jgi:anti-sigma regulatory factor (Ser/Thr protein kinase)
MISPDLLNSGSSSHQITLTNQLEQLEKLSNWLNDLADRLGFASQVGFRLDLILAEIVTNIIENAYEDDTVHYIKVDLQYFDNKVALQIEDDGFPFNPLERPEVEFPEKLEDAKIGGLGIHLIRNYSDECNYQRVKNRNRLKVVIYHSPKNESASI